MKISANPLPNPPDGYEWREQPKILNRESITFVLCPIRKHYDWSKTGPNVFVVDKADGSKWRAQEVDGAPGVYTLYNGWQAHIGGDPCPVDPDATMLEFRSLNAKEGTTHGPNTAGVMDWSVDRIYRVTGLAEGYRYE